MKKLMAIALAGSVALTGCTFTESAGQGQMSMTGAKAHLNTTGIGLKLLFGETLAGSPTINDAVEGLAMEAKSMGASNSRIVQSSSSNLWWILPPLSIIINPVITNVAADVK